MSESRRRGRTVRVMAAFAAFSTTLAIAAVAPATAVAPTGPPYVTYLDSSSVSGAQLAFTGLDGVGSTLLTDPSLKTLNYSASPDGSTVVVGVETKTSTTPQNTTFALVVTHAGASKVLHTYWDAQPAISANGNFVYFLVHGNLWRYSTVTGETKQINFGAEFNPWAAAAGSHSYIYRLAISPDATKAAVLLNSYPNAVGAQGVDRSQIKVFSIAATGPNFVKTPIWTSTNYAGTGIANKQLYPNNFVFSDSSTLIYSECPNNGCTTWTTWSKTVPSGSAPATAAVPTLDNVYDLQDSGDVAGTWYAWQNTTTVGVTTSAYLTTIDPTFATALTPSGNTDWTNGATKGSHIVVSAAPESFATSTFTRLGVSPKLTVTGASVGSGGRVRYTAVGTYPTPISGEVLQVDPDSVYAGQLQYSTNNGGTWALAANTVYGGGLSQKLYRKTWFRWSYPGDVLTRPATSTVSSVTVTPTVTVKVTVSGASRIVSGTAARVGGTVVLSRYYSRAWHKVLSTGITSKGLYSFGKRRLAAGAYKVVTVADASWLSGTKAFTLR